MNCFNQLLKLQATLMGEMKSGGQLIILPREPFINIFNETIAEAVSDDQKEVIKTILSKLLNLSKATQ